MKSGFSPAKTVAVLVLLAVAVAAAAADSDVSAEGGPAVTVFGYVSDVSDETGNVPLAGVAVSLYDGSKIRIGMPVTTGEDGRFEFTYPEGTGRYLSFEMPGYSIRAYPGTLGETEDHLAEILMDRATPDATGKYALSGDGYSKTPVSMAPTRGTIFGYVHGGNGTLENAKVTATSESGLVHSATTDSEGFFQMSVLSGSYVLTASCKGFYDASVEDVTTYAETAVNIVMEQKRAGIAGNLDLTHGMLLVGLALIGALVLAAALIVRKSKKPGSKITIINDRDDLETVSDGDVNRP